MISDDEIRVRLGEIEAGAARSMLAYDVMRTSIGEMEPSFLAIDELVKSVSNVALASTLLLHYIWHEGGRP